MYGKLFASMYTGSMFGSGAVVFAVWTYAIVNARPGPKNAARGTDAEDGSVELNPTFLAAVIGNPVKDIETAIEYLCDPDPRSRSAKCEGRRLIRQGQFFYRLPNYSAYREMKNEEDRKEYNRVKKREERAKKKEQSRDPSVLTSMTVNDMSAMSAQENGNANEQELNTQGEVAGAPVCDSSDSMNVESSQKPAGAAVGCDDSKVPAPKLRQSTFASTMPIPRRGQDRESTPFEKPTMESLRRFFEEMGLPTSEAEDFYDYYESNGWKVGKSPMQNWQASARRWMRTFEERQASAGGGVVVRAFPGNATADSEALRRDFEGKLAKYPRACPERTKLCDEFDSLNVASR